MEAPRPTLDPELAARARRLRIRARRLSSELFTGAFASAFKGRGTELDQVREYMPGDDVRRIDWNVTARAHSGDSARAFLKEHRAERELTVVLLVDMSASGSFGSVSRSKREMAAELAALLAFASIATNDRVGIGLFTDRMERYVPPRKGRAQVARLIRELLTFEPAGTGTNLTAALAYLRRVQRRRAVVFLISDFMARNYDEILGAVAAHHEVIGLRPIDAHELVLPDVGMVTLRDAESGATRLVDTSDPRVREHFAAIAARRGQELADSLRKARVPLLDLPLDGTYVDILTRFFASRRRRR